MAEVRISEGFEEDLGIVLSDKVLDDISGNRDLGPQYPAWGRPTWRPPLHTSTAKACAKSPADLSISLLSTRDEADRVTVLGLVHQRAAW